MIIKRIITLLSQHLLASLTEGYSTLVEGYFSLAGQALQAVGTSFISFYYFLGDDHPY